MFNSDSLKIVLRGQVMVNFPVLVAFCLVAYLMNHIGIHWSISILIGTGVGWFIWNKQVVKWKEWAIKRNVERERIYKLGKLGFINFNRNKIFDEEQ